MPSFLQDLVGSRPQVPQLPPLNLGTEQQTAIQANQAALPGAESLVGKANQFSIDQITQTLNQIIPGYSDIVKTITGNIASEAKGEIPKDVLDLVQNTDAARSLAGGYEGSGVHGDLVARDLGLTSLDLTQRGLTSLESWTKTAASLYEPSLINVSSMFINPQQQASFDVEERNAQFQRQWMQNQINALPAPWAEDLKQFVYRAMSAYSGTSVPNDPYSTPGSFGGGGGGGGFNPGGGGMGGGGYSTNFGDANDAMNWGVSGSGSADSAAGISLGI